MTPVHQVTSCEVKSCVFVNNKSIIKMFLTLHQIFFFFFRWRKHYYGLWTRTLARSDVLRLKRLNGGFVSNKHAAFLFPRRQLMDWSRVEYLWIIVIHWWASDVMLNFSKSLLTKKQTHLLYILDGWRVVHFQQIKFFWWTIMLI